MGKEVWKVWEPRITGCAVADPEGFVCRIDKGKKAMFASKKLIDRFNGKRFEIVVRGGEVGLRVARKGASPRASFAIGGHGLRELVYALESVGYQVEDRSRWDVDEGCGGVYPIWRALPSGEAIDHLPLTIDHSDKSDGSDPLPCSQDSQTLPRETGEGEDKPPVDPILLATALKLQEKQRDERGEPPSRCATPDDIDHLPSTIDHSKAETPLVVNVIAAEELPPVDLNGKDCNIEPGSANGMVEPKSLKPKYRRKAPNDHLPLTIDHSKADTVVTPKLKAYASKASRKASDIVLPEWSKKPLPRCERGEPRDWVLAIKYLARKHSLEDVLVGTPMRHSDGNTLMLDAREIIRQLGNLESQQRREEVNSICERLEMYWNEQKAEQEKQGVKA